MFFPFSVFFHCAILCSIVLYCALSYITILFTFDSLVKYSIKLYIYHLCLFCHILHHFTLTCIFSIVFYMILYHMNIYFSSLNIGYCIHMWNRCVYSWCGSLTASGDGQHQPHAECALRSIVEQVLRRNCFNLGLSLWQCLWHSVWL